MQQDRTIGTKEYRVILEPISAALNPERSKAAIFVQHQGHWLRILDDIPATPDQSDADLLELAWQTAEHHANNS